jgi:hypothetical protein
MTLITRRSFTTGLALLAAVQMLPGCKQAATTGQAGGASSAGSLTPADVRAIAKDAYIYGFPMVDSYRILNAYFVGKGTPEYKGPYNTLINVPRVYTPADTAVQTPNSDTPYSFAGLDLRAEPMVLTIPPIPAGRYFSVQLVDGYTYNFDYIGSRTTGNGGGNFLIAGPSWKGETPKGITKAFKSDTDFAVALIRTQLFNPADIDNVKKIQAGYKVQPLSSFLKQPAPAAAPAVNFFKPLSPDEEKTSPEFFNELNFLLKYAPTVSSEADVRARFAKAGIEGGKTLDFNSMSPELKDAYQKGMADAWADLQNFKKTEIDTGKVTSGDMFGTRDYLKGNYLYRMAAAVLGIFGNSKQEAMYPIYTVDSSGQKLDGANNYTVRFAPGQLPPVNAFWSLTMYKMPQSLLVANPINRYLINSPMLPQLKKDPDGGLTLYIQNKSPGKDKEANWLPAPTGPFAAFMRLYWPKDAALDGQWKVPPMTKVN